MCDACDRGIDRNNPIQWQQWQDQQDAWLRDTIRQKGWAVLAVEDDPDDPIPGFAYTIGLTGFGSPELVVPGLDPAFAHKMLNKLAAKVKAGGVLDAGIEHQLPIWTTHLHIVQVTLMPVPSPDRLLLWAASEYGPDRISALQVVWGDGAGHYPWERRYQLDRRQQPVPLSVTSSRA